MHIGIFTNCDIDVGKHKAETLKKAFTERGISAEILSVETHTPEFFYAVNQSFDVLVALGGDGTLLNLVSLTAGTEVPILGVNIGRLGFLTEIEYTAFSEKTVSEIVEGNFTTESRMLLEVAANGEKYEALNECVVSKGSDTRPAKFQVKVNGKFLDKFISDAYLVATPTGSTGYSLSAGGPIVSPDVSAMVLNPICAHSLHARPVVVSDSSEVEISGSAASGFVQLVLDGRSIVFLQNGTDVVIKKSTKSAKFIKLTDQGFFDKLIEKLNVWGVTKVDEHHKG